MFLSLQEKWKYYLQHIYPYRSDLISYCRHWAGSSDRAADAADEVLRRAWYRLEQLDDPQNAGHWLFSIAHNLCCNRCRHTFDPLPSEEALPLLHSAEDNVLSREAFFDLQKEIEELPPQQRQAVYGYLLLDFSPGRMAALFQVSSHTVSARLYRGLQTLRKKWNAPR